MRTIQTRSDFVLFIQSLREDYLNNTATWENKDIGTFLAAIASWTEDMDGFYLNQNLPIPEKLDWRVLADIFMGGKVYE